MENQSKIITMGALEKYDNLRPQIKPVAATWSEMVEMKTRGKLIPGQLYRITDFVTTVNEFTVVNARSAGHRFDIIVCALTANTLSEQASAVAHSGEHYFDGSRLGAWELKYRLENEGWSHQAGTYVFDDDDDYTFKVVGTVTLEGTEYYLLKGFGMYVEDWSAYAVCESLDEGSTIWDYVPGEAPSDEAGAITGTQVVSEDGKGTITWMKDEFGNECPYDFKNIMFKRYLAADSVSGREGLGGKYMVADPDNCPQGLSVEGTDDFIWAYTFSSDNTGGEQTDYSLAAAHQVHDNVMKPYSGGLPNNVMFGENIYGNEFEVECYDNSFGSNFQSNNIGSNFQLNSIGSGMYSNSIGSNFQDNSIGSYFRNNSIGSSFSDNSIGSYFQRNSIGSDMYGNSIGSYFQRNSIGSDMYGNSIGSNFLNNSIGSNFQSNSIGSNYQYNTVDEGVQNTTTGDNIKYVHVLNGVAGTSSSKLTLTFAANVTYCQMAAKTTAGVLKIWVPADLV